MHRLLSRSDFAAAIGISESSVRRLADSGDLEIYRTPVGHRRIPVSEAIRYVRETGTLVLRRNPPGLIKSDDRSANASDADRLLDALSEGHASAVMEVRQSM